MYLESWTDYSHNTYTLLLTFQLCHKPLVILQKLIEKKLLHIPGVIGETEDTVWKMQKIALFHDKKVKKGTHNLTSLYVYSLFLIFMKKKNYKKKELVIKGSFRKWDSVLN